MGTQEISSVSSSEEEIPNYQSFGQTNSNPSQATSSCHTSTQNHPPNSGLTDETLNYNNDCSPETSFQMNTNQATTMTISNVNLQGETLINGHSPGQDTYVPESPQTVDQKDGNTQGDD